MIGWWIEFGGSLAITLLSLLITSYLLKDTQSPLVYGFVTAVIVFAVITPLLYIGHDKPFLNPASTILYGVRGKLASSTVALYIIAQLLGFFTGYVIFEMITSTHKIY